MRELYCLQILGRHRKGAETILKLSLTEIIYVDMKLIGHLHYRDFIITIFCLELVKELPFKERLHISIALLNHYEQFRGFCGTCN
jgi:hypothetical protein